MKLDFRHHVASGSVAVDVRPNANPADLGCDAASLGLPVCTARVETAAQGYRAMCGLAPTLFDAPSRDHRDDLDWLAHAFLAHTPLGTNAVEAVLGFSWGFTFRGGEGADHRAFSTRPRRLRSAVGPGRTTRPFAESHGVVTAKSQVRRLTSKAWYCSWWCSW